MCSAASTMDHKVVMYNGQPYLTFWNGTSFPTGYGQGQYWLLDSSYNVFQQLSPLNQTAGYADFHEMTITPQNTAMMLAWRAVQVDLSSVGGPTDGYTFDCVFQERAVENDTLIFEWRSLDEGNVPLNETYFTLNGSGVNSSVRKCTYTYFHASSSAHLASFGSLRLVSLRLSCRT